MTLRHGVSNYCKLDHLCKSLCRLARRKTPMLRINDPNWEASFSDQWIPHKRPVMQKVLPCHDVFRRQSLSDWRAPFHAQIYNIYVETAASLIVIIIYSVTQKIVWDGPSCQNVLFSSDLYFCSKHYMMKHRCLLRQITYAVTADNKTITYSVKRFIEICLIFDLLLKYSRVLLI